MDLRQLEYFVAVAEEANFTRAAERVHITQSGVSAQIKQLERELGADLFDRTGRTVALTAAGEAALDHARAALAAAEAVSEVVGNTRRLRRGRLRVGMVLGCEATPFLDALAGFHEAHLGVAITVREARSDQLTDEIRRGGVDLAMIGCAGRPPDDLASIVVLSDWLTAVVPPGHELARRRGTSLAELAMHPIVCMPAGTGLRAAFDQACAAQRVRPAIAAEVSAAEAVAGLAARGFGVGILSTSLAAGHKARLRDLPICDATIPALLAIVWRAGKGAAAAELAERCRTVFRVLPSAGPSSIDVACGCPGSSAD